jgi:acyl dehydratase
MQTPLSPADEAAAAATPPATTDDEENGDTVGSGYFFEDLHEGDTFVSAARTVTEADLVAFAGISGDFNPIHMDAVFSSNGRYGQRVVHGLLGMSIATGLLDRMGIFDGTMVAMLEINEWRFLAPVFIGATVRLEMIIEGKRRTSSGDTGILQRRLRLLDQDDQVLQEGAITVMVRCRDAVPARATDAGASDGH